MKRLNKLETRFAERVAQGIPGIQAYADVAHRTHSMSLDRAAAGASEMLARPHVAARIRERSLAANPRVEDSIARVLLEAGRLAFSDIQHVFDEESNVKGLSAIDAGTLAAIKAIEIRSSTTRGAAGTRTKVVTRIEMHDKPGAMELLLRCALAGLPDSSILSAFSIPPGKSARDAIRELRDFLDSIETRLDQPAAPPLH